MSISSFIGGLFGGDDAEEAARLQAQGADEARQSSEGYYQQGQNYLQPYMTAGSSANNMLAKLLTGTPEEQAAIYETFKSSPLYQSFFEALPEQFRANDGTMASNMLYRSGANIEARNRIASQGAQGALNNWLGLAQGQTSAGVGAAGAGANLAQNQGQFGAGLIQNKYGALGEEKVASSRIGNDLLGSFLGAAGQGIGYGLGKKF